MAVGKAGLTTSLRALVDSLDTNQQALGYVSENISNVNTIGYTRKVVSQETKISNGVVLGVGVAEIRRSVDEFLVSAARVQEARLSQASTLNSYQDRLQQFTFGDPNSSYTIGSNLNTFFGRLEDLSNDASSAVKSNLVVSAATDLATTINTIAENLQKERYNADQDISTSIKNVNSILSNLFDINNAIRQNSQSDGNVISLLDARDNEIMKLQEYVDTTLTFQESGIVSVAIGNNEILGASQKYELTYDRAVSVDDFINNVPLEAIKVVALDERGEQTSKIETIFSGTNDANQVDNVTEGKLKALIQIRDVDLPNLLDQLDTLAYTFSNRINEVHNNGTAFPPPSEIIGKAAHALDDEFYFGGQFRVTLTDASGKPLTNRYGNDLLPLVVNLDEFNGGGGKGSSTIQSLIDEINSYYGAQSAKSADLGPAQDIKIAGVSDNITSVKASGDITFSGQPGDGDTIIINGTTITFVAASPSTNEVLIGSSLVQTLNNLTTALNASTDGDIDDATYTNSNTELLIEFDNAGTSGNSFTIDAGTTSVATASGANLSGGANASGNFTFDFDFTNADTLGDDITFDVTSVNVNSSGASAVTFDTFTQAPGSRSRTDIDGVSNDSVTVSLTGLGLEEGDSFTIDVAVVVTDSEGNTYNDTITYTLTVPDPDTGSTLNKRYGATAISGSGDADLTNATSTNSFMNVSLVDEDGDTINTDGVPGYLRFLTTSDDVRVSIDQLDSTELGSLEAADPEASASNKGISHFFGLNNFFEISSTSSGAALGMGVRSDIVASPSLLASAKVVRSSQTGTDAVYTYELGAANSDAIRDLIKVQDENIIFAKSGVLPELNTNIGSYTSELYGYSAVLANQAKSDFEKQNLLTSTIEQKIGAISGVNLDQEIASTIQYQTSYSASARVVSIIRELFQALENSLT